MRFYALWRILTLNKHITGIIVVFSPQLSRGFQGNRTTRCLKETILINNYGFDTQTKNLNSSNRNFPLIYAIHVISNTYIYVFLRVRIFYFWYSAGRGVSFLGFGGGGACDWVQFFPRKRKKTQCLTNFPRRTTPHARAALFRSSFFFHFFLFFFFGGIILPLFLIL